jgi:hypothetical protein
VWRAEQHAAGERPAAAAGHGAFARWCRSCRSTRQRQWLELSERRTDSPWAITPEGLEDNLQDDEPLKTINYGGGARQFIKPHPAFSFDIATRRPRPHGAGKRSANDARSRLTF